MLKKLRKFAGYHPQRNNILQWSHSEFSKIPRSCYEKSQDWTKILKLYWKYQKTVKWEHLDSQI